MTKVFISYSRKDKVFAGKLTEALEKSELETWIDWEDIPPTADWMDQIHKGIEQTDAFLFLLSPDSVSSKVCGQEVDHAVQNGKRLIPIVVRDVDPNNVHMAVRATISMERSARHYPPSAQIWLGWNRTAGCRSARLSGKEKIKRIVSCCVEKTCKTLNNNYPSTPPQSPNPPSYSENMFSRADRLLISKEGW
jgi:hypothetical protein